MAKEKVRYVKRSAPVRTFLAHWGIFLSLLVAAQYSGHVVLYPKPVKLVEASQEEGDWLSSLVR